MDHQQQSLNELLKWSIENSAATVSNDASNAADANGAAAPPRDLSKGLNPKLLAELMGGPSDADLMRMAMTAILAPYSEVDLEQKLIAWDNLEQLIEQIDNANNMYSLGLWKPLVEQLDSSEPDMRRMAAWCCSTAVQNNVKSQEKLVETGAVKRLAELAVGDESQAVRKKAINALSSVSRNFQPGLDELEKALPDDVWKRRGLDAGDMESVDEVIGILRERAAAMSS